MNDPQRYRVNLLCRCNMDLAYGYGADVDAARANAYSAFRKGHGRRAKPREEVIERVSDDGSHYELA